CGGAPRRATQGWSSWVTPSAGSGDVFEDVGESELDRGEDAGEHEQAHRDRGGEAEVSPRAAEGDAVHHRDQDVRRPSTGTVGEGPALGEQLDRVEVVEVEGEEGDQQRRHRDQQQRQHDLRGGLPAAGTYHAEGLRELVWDR